MNDNPRILYKFPTRERKDKLFACLDNITTLARHDNYQILLTLDLNDDTMTPPEIRDRINSYPNVKAYWGTSNSKVHAINKDMEFAGEWDICIVMADDMIWQVPGFDVTIVELFKRHFPDTNGFLHLPDGTVNERLPTMCIIGRKLYDHFGYLYNPIYQSVYCDNEQFDVVRILGVYKYEPIKLFIHAHPIWGFGKMDALYERNEHPTNYAIDGQKYRERQARNFDLP